MRLTRPITVPALLLGVCCAAWAQQSQDFGDYVVHYNALNTNLLSPAAAREYGIRRAGSRALLNIAVLKKEYDETESPVRAEVNSSAVSLTGQRREIRMQEVDDRGAIYYIGQFRVHNEESLNFTVEVDVLNGEIPPMVVKFRQQFFTDQE